MSDTTQTTCAQLRAILMAPPMEPAPVLAFYPGDDDATAMVVLAPDASMAFATRLYLDHSERQAVESIEAVRRTIHHFALHTIIIPSGTRGEGLLTFLKRFKLPPDLRTEQIDATGAIARTRVTDTEDEHKALPDCVRTAISLGRTALDPFRELASLDPEALIDFSALPESEQPALREQLCATRDACRSELAEADTDPRGQTARFRFSKDIRSLSDLKPEMRVPGIVTNVTEFGAFVNIGIPQEGLVHISEMTGQFVSTPSDVVKPGQPVDVRVLSIDPTKKRLALSLRDKATKPPPRKQQKPRPPRSDDNNRRPQKPRPPQRPQRPHKPKFESNAFGDAFGELGL
jgi:transcriptional accessory protein Tex/SPT6